MVQSVTVGIVGCGVISGTHIESFKQLEGVNVKWACDIKADRVMAKAQKYEIPQTSTNYRELLADPEVDLISICTDHASHAQIAADCFESGKHVLCEKALTATNQQLDQILAVHAKHPELIFAGVFQHRFDGVHRVVRELVAERALGRMLSASMQLRCFRSPKYYEDDWHGTWEKEGGSVLINQAIHFMDAMVWIMGGAKDIAANYANLAHEGALETEDTLTASLTFLSGALGTVEVTSASHINWQHTLGFCGTDGEIILRGGRDFSVSMRDEQAQQRAEQLLAAANDPSGVQAGRAYYGTSHPALIADVVDAFRDKREPFVTGESANHTVRVVLGAYESHRTGGRVNVPAPIESVIAG